METLHIITVLGWLSDFGERSPYNLVTICKTHHPFSTLYGMRRL